MASNFLELTFPNLRGTPYQITSPSSPAYNCIAWAAGETNRWWWPTPSYYWPERITREATISTFVAVFQSLGYALCDDDRHEDGFEKVAIYVDAAGGPTHAARQLDSGGWTSKLGPEVDIRHVDLKSLESAVYGVVSQILKRKKDAR